MIFDGLARVFSTCRRCRELMVVLDADETVHPCCAPKPSKGEQLAANWLSAVLAGDDEAVLAEEIDRLDSAPQLARAAQWYAAWGWPVFPLRPGDKTPATKHGFKDATTDLEGVDGFWKVATKCNVGLATGHLFDVIDIDPRSGGMQSFLKLLEDKRLPEIHGIAVTASGGIHLYVKPTGRGNSAGFMPGVDFRGLGGYVVGPPSTLGPRGRSWSWMVAPSPVIKGDR